MRLQTGQRGRCYYGVCTQRHTGAQRIDYSLSVLTSWYRCKINVLFIWPGRWRDCQNLATRGAGRASRVRSRLGTETTSHRNLPRLWVRALQLRKGRARVIQGTSRVQATCAAHPARPNCRVYEFHVLVFVIHHIITASNCMRERRCKSRDHVMHGVSQRSAAMVHYRASPHANSRHQPSYHDLETLSVLDGLG